MAGASLLAVNSSAKVLYKNDSSRMRSQKPNENQIERFIILINQIETEYQLNETKCTSPKNMPQNYHIHICAW